MPMACLGQDFTDAPLPPSSELTLPPFAAGVIRKARVPLLVVVLAAVGGSESGSQTRSTHPIRQIDHIMIRTGDPSELYAFFADTLQLPIAWPITSPRPGVTTGGVGFGNVNVEAIQVPGQTDPRPRLAGFAFEPSALDESLIELRRRGLTFGDRRPLVATGPDGSKRTLWTNVTLRQFSDSDSPADATIHIFLSEYSPTYVNVDQRRARLRAQLVDSGGGPLGVVDVKEVIIGAVDVERARRLWQRLLEPTPSVTSNTWQIGAGPAVRLVPANESRVQALLIRVASLERAKAFLREKQLLGVDAAGQVTIDPSKIGGVDLRLVER
jgi:catechol 2,3-dioxygenase-like lactoylglutathione lyase family enzyme